MDGIDRSIAELATRQHGVVARRQLLIAGVKGRAIDERLRLGRLHLIHRGVYVVGHRKLTQEARWMSAVLACGTGAVLSHRSAAQIWGLLARTGSVPEVTRPKPFRTRVGISAHMSEVGVDEVGEVEGIPVTSVPRTLLDLAAVVGRHRLERALNEAEVRRLTDRLSLPDLMRRYPRRPGSAVLRHLLSDEKAVRGVTRNQFEERFKALVVANRLPRPRLNADLAVGGRFIEVDCLWVRERLIAELDGRAVHGTASAFESDRGRDRLLLVDGWRSVRITWRQLRDEPDAVARDLRHLLTLSV